jgi:hypothetical protein
MSNQIDPANPQCFYEDDQIFSVLSYRKRVAFSIPAFRIVMAKTYRNEPKATGR